MAMLLLNLTYCVASLFYIIYKKTSLPFYHGLDVFTKDSQVPAKRENGRDNQLRH